MRIWIVLAGLSGAMAVAMGAISAHVAQEAGGDVIATASRYQMWHALALLSVAWLATTNAAKWANVAGILFVAGVVLFCVSLYLSVLTDWRDITMAAPFGGAAFILGWLVLACAGLFAFRKP